MRCDSGLETKRGLRGEQGAIAVEFAIIFPILMVLIFGIIDFGHAWYMKQIVSNASREGARYGTRYTTDTTGEASNCQIRLQSHHSRLGQ